MDKRVLFPLTMFLLAGVSFAYGTWEYFASRSVQATADARLVHVVGTIEDAGVSRAAKDEIYTEIFKELPPARPVLGIDFSGSFASQTPGDACSSDGQRAVCRALKKEKTDAATMRNVCGLCDPIL